MKRRAKKDSVLEWRWLYPEGGICGASHDSENECMENHAVECGRADGRPVLTTVTWTISAPVAKKRDGMTDEQRRKLERGP